MTQKRVPGDGCGAEGGQEGPQEVRVVLADGGERTGYAVRTDVVLLLEPGVQLPVVVVIDGREVQAVAVYSEHGVEPASSRLTAVELPEGTVEVDGVQLPEGLGRSNTMGYRPDPDRPDAPGGGPDVQAQHSLFCLLFPWLCS